MLDRNQVIQYIGQNAPQYGVDPAAMLAVANFEGLGTTPGSTWVVPGEGNVSFGPPSWYGGTPGNPAAGTPILAQQGSPAAASAWAWSPAGLDYWIQQLANTPGVVGKVGNAAIAAIVNNFERPRANLAAGEIQKASGAYNQFQQAIANLGGFIGGGTTNTQTPTDTGAQQSVDQSQPNAQSPSGGGGTPSGLNLSFTDSLQHIVVQALLVIVGLALLLGGIYLLGTRR